MEADMVDGYSRNSEVAMGRNVPFNETAICDECGARGAFDFMGDYACEACADRWIPSNHEIIEHGRDLIAEQEMDMSPIERLEGKVRVLKAALNELRRGHLNCEDCWYSCPKNPEGCCNPEIPVDVCTCGADQHNMIIEAALSLVETEGE